MGTPPPGARAGIRAAHRSATFFHLYTQLLPPEEPRPSPPPQLQPFDTPVMDPHATGSGKTRGGQPIDRSFPRVSVPPPGGGWYHTTRHDTF